VKKEIIPVNLDTEYDENVVLQQLIKKMGRCLKEKCREQRTYPPKEN